MNASEARSRATSRNLELRVLANKLHLGLGILAMEGVNGDGSIERRTPYEHAVSYGTQPLLQSRQRAVSIHRRALFPAFRPAAASDDFDHGLGGAVEIGLPVGKPRRWADVAFRAGVGRRVERVHRDLAGV